MLAAQTKLTSCEPILDRKTSVYLFFIVSEIPGYASKLSTTLHPYGNKIKWGGYGSALAAITLIRILKKVFSVDLFELFKPLAQINEYDSEEEAAKKQEHINAIVKARKWIGSIGAVSLLGGMIGVFADVHLT